VIRSLFLLLLLPSVVRSEDSPVSYHRDIVPLLRANCIGCHKASKNKGGLDLSNHAALSKGGKHGLALKPGKPEDSRLIKDISGTEPVMPEEGEALTAAEVALITRWIAQGAKDDTPAGVVSHKLSAPPTYQRLPSIPALAWSPDGSVLAVAGHHEVLLHAGDGSAIIARLVGESPRVESLAFSRDGKLLAVAGGAPSEYGEIQLWDVAARKLARSIKTSTDSVYGVSYSPDGSRVAVGCADKLVRVFTAADGKEIMKCDNHIDWVFATAFSHDGKQLLSASRDRALKLIDIASGRLIDDVNSPREPLQCLARHPSEDLVAYGSTDGSIRLNKIAPRGGRLAEGDNKENSFVREFGRLPAPVTALAFSADGESLAAVSAKGDARIYKVTDGKTIATLKTPPSALFSIAFHPKEKLVATAGYDGQIRFFETAKGAEVKVFDSVHHNK